MSTELTKEEKVKISLEALAGGKDVVQKLTEKYNVSEDDIKSWINEYGVAAESIDTQDENVDLLATEKFEKDLKFGAVEDTLNYRRLTFWSIFGTVTVLAIIFGLIYGFDIATLGVQQSQSTQSDFYDISEMNRNNENKLNSFGVVDIDEGIFRIPVDSAISEIAETP